MIGKKIVCAAVPALAVAAPMAVATGTAHAAPGSDLDLTTCYIVDDPVDYGDGIDWYKLKYTYKNEGTAPTGDFRMRAIKVYGTDEYSHETQNEPGSHVRDLASLEPGQYRSDFFWVTSNVVQKKIWSIHLDVNNTTGESQKDDSFCTAFVNNT